jgi:hypothetical protein
VTEAEDKIITAMHSYGKSCYLDGLRAGIAEMQLFIAWMTRQPDTKRQAETRSWMERRVLEVKAKNGIDD